MTAPTPPPQRQGPVVGDPETEDAASTLCARLDQVSKLFGSFAALRQVSVDLEPGKCYVLIGENGAGKSTLLRILAGLLRPSFGSVRVFGSQEPHEVRARIGYMSHAPMLYDELTAQENLRYFASLYPDRDCLTPAEALRQVGLDPELNRPIGQYSQGMRQRTSLARVLMPAPELLLLDEPFSNMDVESAGQMVKLLAGFRQQQPDHRPDHPPARGGRADRRLGAGAPRRPRGFVSAGVPSDRSWSLGW